MLYGVMLFHLQIAKWKVKQGQLRSTLLDSLAEKIGVSI